MHETKHDEGHASEASYNEIMLYTRTPIAVRPNASAQAGHMSAVEVVPVSAVTTIQRGQPQTIERLSARDCVMCCLWCLSAVRYVESACRKQVTHVGYVIASLGRVWPKFCRGPGMQRRKQQTRA